MKRVFMAVLILLLGLMSVAKAPPAVADLEAGSSKVPWQIEEEELPTARGDEDVFALHSRPGASKIIYLDFDGHSVSNDNYWAVNDNGGVGFTAEPFDTDGQPSTFGGTELVFIQQVWSGVAEDYAPFNVDVTTEAPPDETYIDRVDANDNYYGTRVVITDGAEEVYTGCNCAGKATYGAFGVYAASGGLRHSYNQPAWVFHQALETTKNTREAISHETGHTFNLSHDGKTGTPTLEYYDGHNAWCPIMGVCYAHPVSQFSKGEYTGATTTQDDLAIIASYVGYRTDDHGNAIGTATSITPAGDNAGVIETGADVDVFSFTSPGGPVSFYADTIGRGANLDIKLEVLNSSGTVIASNNPTVSKAGVDDATGLDASITLTPPSGTNYVRVQGVGAGTADTNYTGYGSVGQYLLTNDISASTPQLNIFNVTKTEGDTNTTFSFKITLSQAKTSNVVVHFATSNGTATTPGDYTSKSVNVTFTPGKVTKWVTVTVIGDNVNENNETFNATLSSPSGATINDGSAVATITDDD